jgi:hypothetical protein
MMKMLSNKKFLIFLGLITFVVFLFSFLYKPPVPLPTITTTSPLQNSNKVNYFDPLLIKFDGVVDHTLVTITSSPAEDWIISNSNKDSLEVKSKQYFRVDTNYTVNIFYNKTHIYTLNFKTIPQQSDPRYAQEVMAEIERDYPLSTKLPYETDEYSVLYSTPLTLEITLKTENLENDRVIAEVKAWVTRMGGNANSHKFVVKP